MKKPTQTRQIVLEILLEIEKGEFSHLLIRSVLDKYSYFSKEDRSFIKRLAAGIIERKITIDYIINQFSKTKTSKCKSVIRNILRMGVYQIYFMDSVPNAVAVDESVLLAVNKGFGTLKGFVNGVLRNIERSERISEFPDLSTKYSIPEELICMLKDTVAEDDLEKVLKAYFDIPPLYIKLNTAKYDMEAIMESLNSEGIKIEKTDGIDGVYKAFVPEILNKSPSFEKGMFYVQDKSSMLSLSGLAFSENMKVLDLCAAPGGKSVFCAVTTGDTANITSCDISEAKTDLIKDNVERLKLSGINAVVRDALSEENEFLDESFDLIIADLPCSGLGVITRKPDIKYRVTKKDSEELAILQRKILDNNIRYLKKGGQLLFSTCTISKLENDENAEYIEKTLGLKLIEKKQLLPGIDDCDGFFYSVFVK